MQIRKALSNSQKEAILKPAGAKVLVEDMNKEIALQKVEIIGLRDNYADLQNKYEGMQNKFHKADKEKGILESKLELLVVIEILKFLTSGVVTGYGFYLLGNKEINGWYFIIGAAFVYSLLTFAQKLRK